MRLRVIAPALALAALGTPALAQDAAEFDAAAAVEAFLTDAATLGATEASVGEVTADGDTVTVDEGAVEMHLENGAVGELRAPVVMQLLSRNRVRLLSGKIKVSAPETAHGFTVETPSAEVVDLGTVFSAEAGETDAKGWCC